MSNFMNGLLPREAREIIELYNLPYKLVRTEAGLDVDVVAHLDQDFPPTTPGESAWAARYTLSVFFDKGMAWRSMPSIFLFTGIVREGRFQVLSAESTAQEYLNQARHNPLLLVHVLMRASAL